MAEQQTLEQWLEGHISIVNKSETMKPEEKVEMTRQLSLDTLPIGQFGTQKPPFNVVTVLIDVSGSTNNTGVGYGSGGRCRGGGKILCRGGKLLPTTDNDTEDQPEIPKLKTKPIIVAELDGVSWFSKSLFEKYEMAGVTLNICTFGSQAKNLRFDLTSSAHMASIVTKLTQYVYADFGGTALSLGLNEIFPSGFEATNDTLLVLASDGQPDSPGNVKSLMGVVFDKFKNAQKKLHILTIGAGSVGQGTGALGQMTAEFGPEFWCRSSKTTCVTTSVLGPKCGSTECNSPFLMDFAHKFATGCAGYTPACRNYDRVKECAVKFLDELALDTNEKRWLYYSFENNCEKWKEYSPEVNSLIERVARHNNDKDKTLSLFVEVPGVGWYFISPIHYLQVTVTLTEQQYTDSFPSDVEDRALCYENVCLVFDVVDNPQTMYHGYRVVNNKLEKCTFQPMLDVSGRLRTRSIQFST